jgi:hypothetical protein
MLAKRIFKRRLLMPTIFAYVGAYPSGQAAPNLFSVPLPQSGAPNNFFVFVLAFANADPTGNFTEVWSQNNITPDIIAQIKQSNSNVSFWASLGGGNVTWTAPANETNWIAKAVNSLGTLINTWHLSGIDVDYEYGVSDPSFVRVMGQVLGQVLGNNFIVPQPGGGSAVSTCLSYSPFGNTNAAYVSLYQQGQSEGVVIHYQAYADLLATASDYMALYTGLAGQYTIQQLPRLSALGLGIASSTTLPRGLQPPNIYTAWNDLSSQGVLSASIWCLEDSAENGYPIETTLMRGASPTPGGVTPSPPISIQTGTTYTVVSGDTFFSIAQKFYGDGN